jgi:hypothetical protein
LSLAELKIHVSRPCKELLEKEGGYVFEERGLIKMKGKGEVLTYWLLRHNDGPHHRRVAFPYLGGATSGYISGASNLDHGLHLQDQPPQLFASLIQMDKKRKKYGSSAGAAGFGGSMSRRGSSATFRGDQGSLINLPISGRLAKQESFGSVILHSPKFTKRKAPSKYMNGSPDAQTREYSPKRINYNIHNGCSATNGAHNITCNVSSSGGVGSSFIGNGLRSNSSWSNFRLPKSSASLASSFAEVLESESELTDLKCNASYYASPVSNWPSKKASSSSQSCGTGAVGASCSLGATLEPTVDEDPTEYDEMGDSNSIQDGIVFRCSSRPRRASTAPIATSGSPLSDIAEQHTPLLSQSICNGCDTIDAGAATSSVRVDLCNNNLLGSSPALNASRVLDKRWRSCADVLGKRGTTIKCDCDQGDRSYCPDGRAESSAHRSSTSNLNRYLESGRQLGRQFLQYLNVKAVVRPHSSKKLIRQFTCPDTDLVGFYSSSMKADSSDDAHDPQSNADLDNECDHNDQLIFSRKDDLV